MKQFLSYIAAACLIFLASYLIVVAIHLYKSPEADYLTTTDAHVFQPEEDIWVSLPVYRIDPEPGQVLTWTGEEFKWVYIKELLEEEE